MGISVVLQNDTILAFQAIPIIEAEQQKYSLQEQQQAATMRQADDNASPTTTTHSSPSSSSSSSSKSQGSSGIWEVGRGVRERKPMTVGGRERIELGKFHAATTLPKDVNLHLSIALIPQSHQDQLPSPSPSSILDERRILRDPSALWQRGCLVIRLRMRGQRTHNRLGYSVCAYPFGSLKPEQLWRSDRATHQLQWTRTDGIYQVQYRRKGLGKVEFAISQLIISGGGADGGSSPSLSPVENNLIIYSLRLSLAAAAAAAVTSTYNVNEEGDSSGDSSCFQIAHDIVWENQGKRTSLLTSKDHHAADDNSSCYCEATTMGMESYASMFSSNPKYLGSLAPWTTDEGIPVASLASHQLPNPFWEWIGDWRVDEVSPGVGADGWIYNSGFGSGGSNNSSSTGDGSAITSGKWHDRPRFGTKVRRRRWIRFRRLKQLPCEASRSNSNSGMGSPRSCTGEEGANTTTTVAPRNDRERMEELSRLLLTGTTTVAPDCATVMASLDYDRSRMLLIKRLLVLEHAVNESATTVSEETGKAVAASARQFFPLSPRLRRQMVQTVLGHYQIGVC